MHSITVNNKGIYLIELVAAVVLMATVAATLALLAPRMVKNNVATRQHSTANNLADSKIQELQTQPYPLMQTTYDAYSPGPWAWFAATSPATNPDTCDCGSSNYQLLLSSDVVTVDGTAYQRYWCIDTVAATAGVWHTYCTPPSLDQYKNIRVWVLPDVPQNTLTVTREATVTRF